MRRLFKCGKLAGIGDVGPVNDQSSDRERIWINLRGAEKVALDIDAAKPLGLLIPTRRLRAKIEIED